MTIPTHCGMPPLTGNIEGLRDHVFMIGVFIPDQISVEERKWKSWVMHCLLKAGRHYNSARDTIIQQIEEARRSPAELSQGRALPILDFAEHMEDCMSSAFRASMCMRQLSKSVPAFDNFCKEFAEVIDRLLKLRNQYDHMHTQIASGQVGSGPIVLALDDDGNAMRFRDIRFPLIAMHGLIEGLYIAMTKLYPKFDPLSTAQALGPITISITASITVTDAAGVTYKQEM
ncbi:hypothetical protein IGS61_25000 [Janthinobacterium sp. FW305-129]|uniref:hypothetical protein n=1 Tax=Janthinobacterium sp. FW305-129 TaxID=2775054 RepID=UPI001E431655|nr:hypothetical protein [Janthinobacterium sp. FW305-129]MCC7600772.1 hypothetical protein [Janthinobacterium sp. FW305-129]